MGVGMNNDGRSVNFSNRGIRVRLCSLLVSGTLLLGVVGANSPAVYAHGGTVHDDRKHAAQDLVGTPVSEIERKTNENKKRIMEKTGVEPGAARSQKKAGQKATFAAVAADPGISGSWSSVLNTEVVPVFQALLPNGKLLIWDSVGDEPTESYPNHDFTRAMVWNPINNSFKHVPVLDYNIFCAGFAHLPNGNILVAGGNANDDLDGIVQTHIFNWQTETWSRGSDMAAGRWYPSVAAMANGEQAIIGGGPAMAEVYQANGAIRTLPGFTNSMYGDRLYPFMISRPDAQLGLFGPHNILHTLVTAGDGVVTATATRDDIYRDYGSFATYDIGKHLVVGGGKITEGGMTNVPTKTALVIDSNVSWNQVITSTSSMSTGRRHHNATVLADGSVLVTGGQTSAATSPHVDLNNAATAAERWDPATGNWTLLSSASRIRQYHSTATLLPDGRVMTGGGGICDHCRTAAYLEKNIEYFTPPYLYEHNGSGQLASRPVIATAPSTIPMNAGFSISSAQAASIQKVALVGLSDVTHAVDGGQRYVPLQFSASGTTLNVTGPPNGGVTPPGYYMLFIVNAAGVPSVASMVKVGQGPNPLMSPVRNISTEHCIDVLYSSLAHQTYLQTRSCNGSKAQALTRLLNDNSLRVLGNCLDVPYSAFAPGQKIWTMGCNGTDAQKWQFTSDGTIRLTAHTNLCLSTDATSEGANLVLATCNGSALQKWTW